MDDGAGSIWESMQDYAEKAVAMGKKGLVYAVALGSIGGAGVGAYNAYDAVQQKKEQEEIVFTGEIDEQDVSYRENVPWIGDYLGDFDANVMDIREQDGDQIRLVSYEDEKDLSLDAFTPREDKVDEIRFIVDGDTTRYEDEGEAVGQFQKATKEYNSIRNEIKDTINRWEELGEWSTYAKEDLQDIVEGRMDELDLEKRTKFGGRMYGGPYNDTTLTENEADQFGKEGLARAVRLMEAFQDQEYVDRVGEIMKKDLATEEVTVEGVDLWGNDVSFDVQADTTEFGGLIQARDDSLEIDVYEPQVLTGNGSFRPGVVMGARNSFATFHLHAVDQDGDAEYAGPSVPDLGYNSMLMEEAGSPVYGVVLTYVGNDEEGNIRFNADLYQVESGIEHRGQVDEKSAVIDLGTYTTNVSREME